MAHYLQLEVVGDGPLAHHELERIVIAALILVGAPEGQCDIGVEFVAEEAIARLNHQHLDSDVVTDVLSFPIDGVEPLADGVPRQLGDVVVCPAYVAAQLAAKRSMYRGDHNLRSAVRRCVVHGVLHLLGEDHEAGDEQAARMFALEQKVLDLAAGVGQVAALRPEAGAGEP